MFSTNIKQKCLSRYLYLLQYYNNGCINYNNIKTVNLQYNKHESVECILNNNNLMIEQNT